MKIHLWTEDMAPDFTKSNDGDLQFFSHPDLWNFSSGDQIHYKTRLGVSVFEVIDIHLARLINYDRRMQVITAKKLD